MGSVPIRPNPCARPAEPRGPGVPVRAHYFLVYVLDTGHGMSKRTTTTVAETLAYVSDLIQAGVERIEVERLRDGETVLIWDCDGKGLKRL